MAIYWSGDKSMGQCEKCNKKTDKLYDAGSSKCYWLCADCCKEFLKK